MFLVSWKSVENLVLQYLWVYVPFPPDSRSCNRFGPVGRGQLQLAVPGRSLSQPGRAQHNFEQDLGQYLGQDFRQNLGQDLRQNSALTLPENWSIFSGPLQKKV